MKKKLLIIMIFVLAFSLVLSMTLKAKADSTTKEEEIVTCDDLVESNGGFAEFKEIDPVFSSYNINNHSDTIDTTNTIEKVLVLGTESSDTVFTFKMHLNRDKLTKYFNIIEWFIVPTKVQPFGAPNYGAEAMDSDFDSFEITITDVSNPDKYVVFKASTRPDSTTYCTHVSGRAGANDQSVEGIHPNTPDEINKSWGTPLKASFVGCFSNSDSVPEGYDYSLPLAGFLSLDYDTKQVFSVTGNEKGKRVLVKDLDDGRYMLGTDLPWDGFDSKELEVSIRFSNIVSGRTAQIAVLGFNGMDFTKGKVIDALAPDVMERTVIDEASLYGEVGRAMPITECYAYDLLDGYIESDDIEYKVFYKYKDENQRELEIIDGKFTPDRDGIFSIVARATDRYGNVGEYVREVTIRKVINDLHIDLLEDLPTNCTVGERVSLPKAVIYGGSVNKKYEVSVLYGNEEVEIDSNNCFVPSKQGIYIVRYTATDFYNEPKYFDYSTIAVLSDTPVVYFPRMDSVVESGSKLSIPAFSAMDYSSFGDGVNANISYYILEPSTTEYKEISKDYVLENEGLYKFKITASSVLNSEKSVSKEYEIYAKNCRLIRDYFITDNVDIVEERRDMVFKTNTDGSFYFLNPVLVNSFELDFNAKCDSEYAPTIIISLTDSENRDNTITLKIDKDKVNSSIISNLDNSATIKGAVGNNNYGFSLSYRSGWIYDGTNAAIKLTSYDNGVEFDGFKSKSIYVSIAIKNTNGDTKLYFTKFCGNQDFSYNADDITEPTIVYSDLGRVYKIGDEVSFTYDSFDLFDRECIVTVRVEHNGEKLATGIDGECSFVITEFGKYSVIFKANDKFGNETSLSFNVYCYDSVKPTISVKGSIASSCALGSSINLPTAEVSDNEDNDLSYSIYAKRPTGSFVIIDNQTFTPDVKGKWTIYYYTVDSCGNYVLASFDVYVS